MARIMRTSDGDRLDTLCYHIYGTLDRVVELVLEANPGLAAIAQPYASGVIIFFPDSVQRTEKPIQLWS